MIVVFHMAVYFAYHIWNNYISHHNNGDRSDTSNANDYGDRRQIDNNLEIRSAPEENGAPRSNVPSNQSDPISVNNTSPNPSKVGLVSEQKLKEEALQILQKIEFEEQKEGHKIIYDVEPEFYSLFTPGSNGLKFFPPVFLQRYMVVDGLIRGPCWSGQITKVIEFGCAELTFIWRYLKRTNFIREIVAVDIDRSLLERHVIKLSPTPSDHLQKRSTPLNIKVFKGSVADTNVCLQGADAVIAIELIEHLFPPELERLPFVVFGFIKPKLAIFTTPNGEFNVLFGGDPLKFRHDDHKFEWSRQQFEDWGNNLVERFPDYRVTFQGIGPGPEGTDKYGFCSQMAVFVKLGELALDNPQELNMQEGTYDLVMEYEFPYDERSEDQKIRDELVGFLNRCASIGKRYWSGDDENEDLNVKREISLTDIMSRINCADKEKVKEVLSVEKWEVKTNSNGNEVVVLPNSEDSDEFFEDYNDYDLQQEDEDNNHLTPNSVTEIEEDWGCNQQLNFAKDHLEDCVHSANNAAILDSFSQTSSLLLPKDLVPDTNSSCDKFGLLPKNMALEQTNLDLSVYETPCVSDSEFILKDQPSPPAVCKKKLSFDEDTLVEYEAISNDSESFANTCLNTSSLGYSDNSKCDVSIYSTPCGSQNPRINVPKSFSLQQIENTSVSKGKECFADKKYNISDEEVKKVSRSLEGLKNEGSIEICKSFPSFSRVIDSGYPDSNSEQEMDLDLTLEQFDEIESLSDNESNSLPSPVHPIANLPHLIDDVENGDVANNNRDGEGNNLVADMDEEPLEFEAQIQVDNEVLNFDGAGADMDVEHMDFNGQIEERHDIFKVLSMESVCKNQSSTSNQDSPSVQGKRSFAQISTNGCDKEHSKPTPSCTSVETTGSWSYEENGSKEVPGSSKCLKTHNSLTTVLDGCSKFSECSLVKSSGKWKKNQLSGNILQSNEFTDLSSDLKSEDSQLDGSSTKSIYESSESLISYTSESNELSPFPKWLLDLPIEDEDLQPTDSEESIWDTNSYHIMGQPVTIPLDLRGGGDPQRNTWL